MYNGALWVGVLFANNSIVLTASMPSGAYLHVLIGCMPSGMLIITPPLLSPNGLSHLIATWLFWTIGEGSDGVSHVSQKHMMLAC